MKVVDMFGAGLPVCATSFECLDELVQDHVNGRIFATTEELGEQLKELVGKFPENAELLETYRKGVEEFQKKRWEDNWRENAKPVLL